MKDLEKLLNNNVNWAEAIKAEDPDFFAQLAQQQSPEYLWIGCSDSRVPANQITGLAPGEVFVHRNIANLVVHTDINCLSVIQYAVDVLKVKHIIVCGHYGCGGVKASMEGTQQGLINDWLQNLRDVYRIYQHELDAIVDEDNRANKLCELSVKEQVSNVCNTNTVKNAWKNGQDLTIHGWIYSIKNGILKDLEVSTRD